MIGRLLRNVADGRVQKLLAATTALSAPALGLEVYFEHYKGSFGDKWMWTPLVLTPPLTAAGVAGFASERAARTALPLVSALYFLDGRAKVEIAVARGKQLHDKRESQKKADAQREIRRALSERRK